MVVIIITHKDRYYPAELIGTTGRALLQGGLGDGGEFTPRIVSFKSAKGARRFARRRFGAGTLDMGKWQAKLQRGQKLLAGNLVTVNRCSP